MMGERIWLSSPHMGGSELGYVQESFDSNWIAPLGNNVDAFEISIKEYIGIKDAIVMSSGTSAIHLALVMLGVGYGDEVLVSSFTFAATVNPIVYQKAIPVLIDSEPDTWNMCPDLLEEAIKNRIAIGKVPKAIILVHLYGMPAKINSILNIAKEYNIPVIEDAAEALGSRYKEKPVGSFGQFSVLSFNGNKIITTSAGGALLSNDSDMINRARYLSSQARREAPHYQHDEVGYNYRMSNVLAGIGRGQMEVLDQRVSQRRENHRFYKSHLQTLKGIQVFDAPNSDYFSNHWLTAITLDGEYLRNNSTELRLALEAKNIESRPLWKPMHLQPVFEKCPKFVNGTSEKLFSNGLCLPSGSNLSDDQKNLVINSVIKCLS